MKDRSKIEQPVAVEFKRFNDEFAASLRSETNRLQSAIDQILNASGKHVRPLLVLLTAKACGQVTDNTINSAVLLELLHTATLIHDDVIDETKQRRGVPSLNAIFDNRISVLVGDYVLSTALIRSIQTGNLQIIGIVSNLGRDLSEGEIKQLETAMDDDTESIITNERYTYISSIIKECYTKKEGQKLTTSDKIDKIVTNRWLALPIFAVVMFIVYYVSVTTVGAFVTDWTNDVLFGEIIPPAIESGLNAIGCAAWLQGLILDGIVAGVGAVLGFVPQMLVLFAFLAFLESCGYMARVAFIMDRIFRKFGLSGKSFIPMLIGSGCGVPGVMASRTIENDRDRKMTIMTTTFVPCGAKLPIIAMIAGAFFGNSGWVATSCYFVGIAAIICSGIILKKTKMFAGDPAPFVMELPAYHWPTVSNILRSMWERGWSFIKKAGTIILLSTIILWFLMSFGWEGGSFGMVEELNESILSKIGTAIAWIFAPLGWTKAGEGWKMAVAAVTGLIAKENVVATFGMLYGFAEVAEDGAEIWGNLAAAMTPIAAYGFLVFNLLCAPCFAAMGAIKREMNNTKWFLFAIGYQCGLAYLVSLCIYQIGTLVTGGGFGIWTVVAFAIIIGFLYLLFRPYKESGSLNVKVKGMAKAR